MKRPPKETAQQTIERLRHTIETMAEEIQRLKLTATNRDLTATFSNESEKKSDLYFACLDHPNPIIQLAAYTLNRQATERTKTACLLRLVNRFPYLFYGPNNEPMNEQDANRMIRTMNAYERRNRHI
jgi:hypothetical protein